MKILKNLLMFWNWKYNKIFENLPEKLAKIWVINKILNKILNLILEIYLYI